MLCLHACCAVNLCVMPMQVVGMGLLLTFIGLQTSKIVVPDAETMVRHRQARCRLKFITPHGQPLLPHGRTVHATSLDRRLVPDH